jgi:hypothetical protein
MLSELFIVPRPAPPRAPRKVSARILPAQDDTQSSWFQRHRADGRFDPWAVAALKQFFIDIAVGVSPASATSAADRTRRIEGVADESRLPPIADEFRNIFVRRAAGYNVAAPKGV